MMSSFIDILEASPATHVVYKNDPKWELHINYIFR
jgi:hypothetical protein